ncbi:GlxA family transcriptional regulator [Roseovarius sp.]|jgi:transcriptional regulator GlxA family with amidase domain
MNKIVRSEPAQLRHFDIIVADGFVLSELAAITDAIRISNRVSAMKIFSWSFHSVIGGMITSPSGLAVETSRIPDRPSADAVFVIGNVNPRYGEQSVARTVSRYRVAGARVYLLAEAATRYIAETGNSNAYTTHWENYQLIRETIDDDGIDLSLAREGRGVVTCAGMGATLDVVLSLIGELATAAVRSTVADVMLHQRVRDLSSLQPYSRAVITDTGDEIVNRSIQLMQTHIEDPLWIKDIVESLGISSRLLERRFAQTLNTSPHVYYRRIRLIAAKNLLLNSAMTIQEVAIACGFNSGFAAVFKKQFGLTPAAMRRGSRDKLFGETS